MFHAILLSLLVNQLNKQTEVMSQDAASLSYFS
jgi:hypothetical protein